MDFFYVLTVFQVYSTEKGKKMPNSKIFIIFFFSPNLYVLLIFFGANFLSYESIKKSFFLEKRLKWAQELKYGVFERYTQLIFHLC